MKDDLADERQQMELVIDRLAARLQLPRETVSLAVDDVYRSLDASTIRDFIPLLVERRAARELRDA